LITGARFYLKKTSHIFFGGAVILRWFSTGTVFCQTDFPRVNDIPGEDQNLFRSLAAGVFGQSPKI